VIPGWEKAELAKILIVDDEETVRQTFREWLESADLGCRILTAQHAGCNREEQPEEQSQNESGPAG